MHETKDRLRILIDTNILISASLRSSQMLNILNYTMDRNRLLICNESLEEGLEVIKRKFPKNEWDWKYLISRLNFETVYSPTGYIETPPIRDENDFHILCAAISANPDIFVTGDKDFHTEDIKKYLVVYTPADFIRDFVTKS